jgi:hypothetical protein
MTRGVWFGLAAVFLAISGISYFARRPQPANVQAVVVSNPAPAQASPQPTPAYQPPPQQPPETPPVPASNPPADDAAAAPQQQPEPVQPPPPQPEPEPDVLPAPRQLSPMDGFRIDADVSGVAVLLSWEPVPGATSYLLEVDCMHCCRYKAWCTDLGRPWFVSANLTQTQFLYNRAGVNAGRWRVWAVFRSGRTGPQSPWWRFDYVGE